MEGLLRYIILITLTALVLTPAHAQRPTYPERPVRLNREII